MNDLRKAADYLKPGAVVPIDIETTALLVNALRQALAQPEQEPVAWGMPREDGVILDVICTEEYDREPGDYTIPLYTAPSSIESINKENQMLKKCLKQTQDAAIGLAKANMQALAQPEYQTVSAPQPQTFTGQNPYTAPPKREWVGLTDDEKSELAHKYKHIETGWYHNIALIAEVDAKLKEKNCA